VVFVDGDDPVLVSNEVSRVVDELVGDGDRTLAVEDFAAEEVDVAAVADACATPPFLSDRRIVVVRDAGRFTTDEVKPLLAYLDDPLPTTTVVLAAGGGALAPKLSAAVKAGGQVIGTKVTSREAGAWIHGQVRRANLHLDPDAEALMAAHLGEDVSRTGALLEVLNAAYGDGARLGPAEVAPYLGEAGSVAPWDFTDAIDAGDADLALRLLHRLLGAGERHPLVVLAILHRHVQSLLRVDSPDIRSEAQAAAAMGIAPGRSTYPAKKALTAAGRWGSTGIAEAVGLVADAEVGLKGAMAWPEDAILEVLVARLCRLARAGRPALSRGSPGGRGSAARSEAR
jgi:DNA polymerase-3 subunit delta